MTTIRRRSPWEASADMQSIPHVDPACYPRRGTPNTPTISPGPLSISINTAIRNKQFSGAAADQWRNVTYSPDQLMHHVSGGYAWSARNHGRHGRKGFQCTNTLGFDVDHGADPEETAHEPFVTAHALFIHTTASHTPDNPRFRVIFQTDTLITDPATYQRAMQGLNALLGGIGDPATFDAGRMWYGAEDCEIWPMTAGNTVPLGLLLEAAGDNPPERTQKPASAAQRHEPARHTDTPAGDADSPLNRVWAAIVDHYGATFNGDNSAAHVPCIHPERHNNGDSKPSAKLNRDRRVMHCYACGRDYLAKDVAAALGIEWPKSSGARGDGLSNRAREILLQAGLIEYARVFGAAIRAGLAGQWVTNPQANAALHGLGVGRKAIEAATSPLIEAAENLKAWPPASAGGAVMACADHEACSQGIEQNGEYLHRLSGKLLGTSNLVTGQSVQKIKADIPILASLAEKLINPPAIPAKRGRPTKYLYFPTAAELDALLAVPIEYRGTCDTLPDAAFKSAAAYRAALHRALIERNGQIEWSNRQVAARLGVNERTVRRIDRRAGIKKSLTYRRDTMHKITPEQLEGADLNILADSVGCSVGALLVVDGHTGKPYPVTPNGARAAQEANRAAGRAPIAYVAARGPQRREARPLPAVSPQAALEATEKQHEAQAPAQPETGLDWLEKRAERGAKPVIVHCPNCGQISFDPAEICPYCQDLTTWRSVPMRGGIPWRGEYVAAPSF